MFDDIFFFFLFLQDMKSDMRWFGFFVIFLDHLSLWYHGFYFLIKDTACCDELNYLLRLIYQCQVQSELSMSVNGNT